MTIKDLIDKLSNLDPSIPVSIALGCGVPRPAKLLEMGYRLPTGAIFYSSNVDLPIVRVLISD